MSSRPTPIPIGRKRSASESSVDSSSNVPALSPGPGSTASQSPPQHTAQSPVLPNKAIPSSPILSYFFNKDGVPKSPNALRPTLTTLPTAGIDKDASAPKPLSPVLGHHRAMSMSSGWPRFPTSNAPVVKDAQERGAGIFRRLSISGASPFQRPTVSSNEPTNHDTTNALHRAQTVSANSNTLPRSRPHGRRATLSPGDTPRPRAPSPIGERMLKGHFDGFV